MAEVIEIPTQTPTAPNVGQASNIPAPAPVEVSAVPMSTPTAQSADESNRLILYIFLGLLFFAALLYLLFFSRKGTSVGRQGEGRQGRKNDQQQAQQPETRIQYVNTGGGGTGSNTTNPNAVAYMFKENADILEVQKTLNSTCLSTIGGTKITEDGKLGNETLNAILKTSDAESAKALVAEIRRTNYVTAEQMKWMKKPCPSKGTGAGKSITADGGIDANIDANTSSMSRQQLIDFIVQKQRFPFFGEFMWYTEDLVRWAQAIKDQKATFHVRRGNSTGTYHTLTGYRKSSLFE
jgi:hypothetical protein